MRKKFFAKAALTLIAALFGLTEANAQTVVSDVSATHVGPTYATLSWTAGNSTSLRYRVAGTSTTYTFDNSQLSPWTTFTKWTSNSTGGMLGNQNYHGTQFVWAINSTCQTYRSYQAGTGLGRNGSTDMVISGSYCSNSNVNPSAFSNHAIEPDNFLVSPQITLGGTISFWAKGMDPAECAENFGVFYTTSATPNSSATWTQIGSNQTATAEWTQYIFDLGNLSGTGYVAIRHYDCYDQDLLCVDDIVLTAPGGDWTTITIPSGTSYDLTGLTATTAYQVEVQVGNGNNRRWIGTFFSTTGNNPVPANVAATTTERTANISWWGLGDSYIVKYKKDAKDGPQYFYDDFEDGISQWTVTVGSNGSNNSTWQAGTVPTAWKFSAHSGSQIARATSWNGTNGDFQADYYLITPKVLVGKKVKFWARSNPGYPDSYEVLLSTGGNSINDFTVTLQATKTVPAVDDWSRISIDVPDQYVDKECYIAIHHNMYGGNFIAIDDFGIFEDDVEGSGDWKTVTTENKSVELTGLIPGTTYEYTVTSVKSGEDNAETQIFTFTTLPLDQLALVDDGENSEVVAGLGGASVNNVSLPGRTLKAGTWNTLCLPINLNKISGTSLADADIRELTGATYNPETKKLTLNFSSSGVTKVVAGTPYIVKPKTNAITNISFGSSTKKVQVRAGMHPVTINLIEGEDVSIMFRGTYDKVSFDATDRSILFMKSNQLVFPVAGSYFNAQRAYFAFKGIQTSTAIGNLIKEVAWTDLDSDDPTGISELFGIEETGTWYDLNGRKLAGKPAQKGIYINNGKKTIIK